MEMQAVETLIDSAHQDNGIPRKVFTPSPGEVDQVSTVLASISPTLDNALLYESLRDRYDMGNFRSSIGSTNRTTSQFLVENDTKATEPTTDNDLSVDSIDMLDDLYYEAIKGNIYLYDIMVSAYHEIRPKGIDASHIPKIWRIDLDSANQTLEVTSHHSTRISNPTLSRKFGTNDRMLRYKILEENFFMDTYFSTKTAGKYSRVNTCYQLFVTYKGFVYMVPMKSKSEVI